MLITTHDLAGVEGIADRVGILVDGRLVLDDEMEPLKGRFRRLRWRPGEGGVPGSPTGFHPLRQTTKDWGIEAIVDDFDEPRFEHFRQAGAADAAAEPLSLEEIFVAVAGDSGSGSSSKEVAR